MALKMGIDCLNEAYHPEMLKLELPRPAPAVHSSLPMSIPVHPYHWEVMTAVWQTL